MSKYVREKCGILCISTTPSSKRDITPTKIDANWGHSNLICSTVKQSHAKFQLNMSKHVREKCKQLRISSIITVKPVYNGHSMEKQKVAVVDRWPLYRGSKFSMQFHLFSFIQTFSVWKAFSKGLLSQHQQTLLDCWFKITYNYLMA